MCAMEFTENTFVYQGPKKPKTAFRKSNAKSVSRTRQSFRDECNINMIMDKIERHMINTSVNRREPKFGDYSDMPDYATALNSTIAVRNAFNVLPAEVRARFANNPQELVKFMDDPNNLEEARKLGLVPKDMSKIKYVNSEGVDITDSIFEGKGFFVDGVRVNRDGTPYVDPTPAPAEELPAEA